ncbi:MAG: hypothetical protein VKM92_06205 [Cyanobacteriota bacterium]|nr:hypothetical protein [Cyanobacteriota bacterium]
MTDSDRVPSRESSQSDCMTANAIDPDSDPLEDDEIAALSGGSHAEGVALMPTQDEALIITKPQSL